MIWRSRQLDLVETPDAGPVGSMWITGAAGRRRIFGLEIVAKISPAPCKIAQWTFCAGETKEKSN